MVTKDEVVVKMVHLPDTRILCRSIAINFMRKVTNGNGTMSATEHIQDEELNYTRVNRQYTSINKAACD
jgi:hypothetical protein